MKQPWQQQQAQLQKQQRQQQMGAAWLKQQKAKQAQQPEHLAEPDEFNRVELAAANLKQQVNAGQMTTAQAKDQMQQLMVQDQKGSWWTVGFETGEWYRYTGTTWVKGQPRRRQAVPSATRPSKTHPVLAVSLLIVGLVLTAGAGFLAGNLTFELLDLGNTAAWIAATAVWLVGLIGSLKLFLKVKRGS